MLISIVQKTSSNCCSPARSTVLELEDMGRCDGTRSTAWAKPNVSAAE